jgi:pimeloyl-ACP methyl ester carboxylesterase
MKRLALVFCFLFLSVAGFSQAPESRWATFEGSKIHYYDTGSTNGKDAIVLIHGWSCNADFWKQTFNAFPNYRVITIDLPGHGKSDAPYLTYSMEQFARSVEAVLAQAKARKALLVGHSMGTVVARKFYKLFASKTIAIVIVDMPVQSMGSEEDLKKLTDPVTADYPKSAEGFVDGMVASIRDRELKGFIRRTMLSTPKHAAVGAMNEIFAARNWGSDTIDVPVFAIAAKTDDWQPSEEHYKKIAPKAEFQLWTDVGHFLHMEQPARFNGQVKGWIMRNRLL